MATNAALATLDHIWGVLEPMGHSLALMGGLSLAAWNYIRATRDVDLLIAVDRSELDEVMRRLKDNQCRPKRSPPLTIVGDHCFLQFLYTPPGEFYDVQFDLLLSESELQRSALRRSVERSVHGLQRPIKVLHCDDLILFKLVAGRLIDRSDAAMLLRENRQFVDVSYLHFWITQLGLSTEFAEIWREAFPGELPPTA
ncbi:MAG: nucleotidyl transferase AbiEii/AbiGii toxin family protein [Pirellulaceae bacterium]|nr:nucleotidyl transferase AbiEii/AbiGii toxin family protein [Planctomycetales bacterium]